MSEALKQTVLITGAGRGLGRALAAHLAAPGMLVLLHYHHSTEGVAETAQMVRERGAEPALLGADLSRLEQREALAEQVTSLLTTRGLGLHLLLHNAGVYPEADLLEITPEQWLSVMETNCGAVFHLSRALLPMLERGAAQAGRARVLVIGDSGAERVTARVRATPYHVAKLGAHVLVRSFAKVLTGRGITVNMVSPGFLENSVGEPGSPVPAGRLGAFRDILGAVDYLLGEGADYVSGANIIVSGGWNL
ncbi:MAG: SDR family oxidoreductase [Deltaproteobacteria bacterium]|nr:SDR family oxidoreductase [Deltaproteobacteria bacterium]